MRRQRFIDCWPAGLSVLAALAACGTSPQAHDASHADGSQPCRDEYLAYAWQLDGNSGEERCLEEPWAYGHSASDSVSASRAALEVRLTFIGSLELLPPTLPFCTLFEATFDNMLFVTGATGPVSSDRWAIGDGTSSNVFPDQRTAATQQLCTSGGDGVALPTSGTWHVLQGGELGEIVEVEFRDVTFAPVDGHELRYDYIRWRVRLPAREELVQYP